MTVGVRPRDSPKCISLRIWDSGPLSLVPSILVCDPEVDVCLLCPIWSGLYSLALRFRV